MVKRTLTVSALHGDYEGEPVAFIRLKGRWLQEAGFHVGGKFRVEGEDGRLVITLLTPVEEKHRKSGPLEFPFMKGK